MGLGRIEAIPRNLLSRQMDDEMAPPQTLVHPFRHEHHFMVNAETGRCCRPTTGPSLSNLLSASMDHGLRYRHPQWGFQQCAAGMEPGCRSHQGYAETA